MEKNYTRYSHRKGLAAPSQRCRGRPLHHKNYARYSHRKGLAAPIPTLPRASFAP